MGKHGYEKRAKEGLFRKYDSECGVWMEFFTNQNYSSIIYCIGTCESWSPRKRKEEEYTDVVWTRWLDGLTWRFLGGRWWLVWEVKRSSEVGIQFLEDLFLEATSISALLNEFWSLDLKLIIERGWIKGQEWRFFAGGEHTDDSPLFHLLESEPADKILQSLKNN